MKICYFDAFSGISGDMTVGALVDAGADATALTKMLASLGTGATFHIEKTKRRGIAASKFTVDVATAGHPHRHLKHIVELIGAAELLPERTKLNAIAVFQKLGAAEAKVHDMLIEKVHFHEVGAVDSICDIVGACAALELLGVEEIHSSAINLGSGTVNTEHGVLPVPAPATAELLAGRPVYARGPSLELTTPTGAAIVSTLATSFGAMPPLRLLSTGYGAGDKDFSEHANVLRAIVGERSGATEATTVSVLEANIDDASPQLLGYTMERLLEAGALDVTLQPVLMKKNRQGTLLRVIAQPADQEDLARMIFAETTTLGLRIYSAERRVQSRKFAEVETRHGKVRVKVSEDGSFAPEYEDCRDIARKTGTPLKEVLAAAHLAYLKITR
jgi:pyridinium-3,5-bisthiocarboxylic acid mononucleotide nickel chelatase